MTSFFRHTDVSLPPSLFHSTAMVGKAPVSFGFLKKQDKKLTNLPFEDEKNEKTDFVTSVEENKITSIELKEENSKSELVIPLILKNKWGRGENTVPINEHDDSLEAKAAREIIEETFKTNGQLDSNSKRDEFSIPIFIQNKIPDGYETKDKLDVSLRPDEATLEDYDDVPVEQYGLAMLRGMGWKPGTPIGSTNKLIAKPLEAVIRPRGLGLGADVTAAHNLAKTQLDQEDKGLVKGVCVQIQSGSHKGKYGKIEGQDEDTARLMIELALGGKIVTVTQYSVIQVSESEYKDKAKVLNNESYDKYKIKTENFYRDERENRMHKKRRSRSRSPDNHGNKKETKYESSDNSEADSESERIWVRPFLRVRFIDKKFKHGKYFNTKLVIVDVASVDRCVCKMDDGRILDGICQKWLETIVPRSNPAYVMVIEGQYNGELGEILDRDKSKCIASVQLLRDRLIVQLEYDSVCEYVGDITAAQDY